MKCLSILAFLCLTASAHATYMLRTLDQRWEGIGLIAVVEVGPVSQVTTPQGLVLQSATAKVQKVIYRRYPAFEGKPKDEVVLYSFMPNGFEVSCPAPLRLSSGRAFVMMAEKGLNKFFPSDPWEFQPLKVDKILWPTKAGIREKSLEDVIAEISAYAVAHPQKK